MPELFKGFTGLLKSIAQDINILLRQLLLYVLALALALPTYGQRHYTLPRGVSEKDYSQTEIIVKLRPEAGRTFLNKPHTKSKRVFSRYASSSDKHPLKHIYKLSVEADKLEATINQLLQRDEVVYAEPYFYHSPLYLPNDPAAHPNSGSQYYLNLIKAYDAWTVEKGDSTVVIAILDSGVQMDHPDLADQIAINADDPINGIDDDNDGLIDNYAGWDLADNDNNPEADSYEHGTQVTGMSSARVDNGEGMAGTGFRCKFMPIKVYTSGTNNFRGGYEAIALAADLGCKVINLSWGVAGGYSQFGQDVIDYATLEKDALVVAAAGNTNALLHFFPASFNHVLSVGASNANDEKSWFSTYSYYVDVIAPGIGIYTTDNGGSYFASQSGTSLSAPLVAGAAALVRSRYPNLSALQVLEKIRVSADDIYGVSTNSNYQDLLGKGRLNMLKALTDNSSPALRLTSGSYQSPTGLDIYAGDTIDISLYAKNYLTALSNGTITLTSQSPYVEILNGTWSINSLPTLAETNNTSHPFRIRTVEGLPPNEELVLKVVFSSGSYRDYEYIVLRSAPNYTEAIGGKLKVTVSADGNLGYDNEFFQDGNGIVYEQQKVLDNIGVIFAFDEKTVADNAPVNLTAGFTDTDFTLYNNLKRYTNSDLPVDVRSTFSIGDSLRIEQKTLGNTTDDFVIQEYRVINRLNSDMPSFFLSLFADWNIGNTDMNTAGWDGVNKLGYIHNGDTYMGIALLTSQDSLYSAINNINFNGNSADIPATLTDSVKYHHSARGIFKASAGTQNGGNDVSHLIGGEVGTLPPYGTEKLAFVFIGAHSLAELQSTLQRAKDAYSSYQNNPPLLQTFFTCQDEPASINPASGSNYQYYGDPALSDLLFEGETLITEPITSPVTYYVVNTDSLFTGDIQRVEVKPKNVQAGFEADPAILLLDETGNNTVTFMDTSLDGESWSWEFGNGLFSTMQHPTITYSEPGMYEVRLEVTNDLGCTETIQKSFEVAYRSNLPALTDLTVCAGEELTLNPANATNIEIYNDEALTELLYAGSDYTTAFTSDTALYIVSTDSAYQSNIKKVVVDVAEIDASFIHYPDTTDLTVKSLIRLSSTTDEAVAHGWYINDQPIGSGDELAYNYSGQSILNVLLVAENANGCRDSTRTIINISPSPAPEDREISFCPGASVEINPEGNYFNFYSDEALTALVAKGSITIPELMGDSIFYITNMSLYGESEAARLQLSMSNIQALFSATPEELNLMYSEPSVELLNQSINADTYIWLINGDTLSTESNATAMFETPGQYQIALSAKNNLGCEAFYEVSYLVTHLTANEGEQWQLIFPNPTGGVLQVRLQGEPDYQVIHANGQLLQAGTVSNNTIDFGNLPAGIYMLNLIHSDGNVSHHRIVKH